MTIIHPYPTADALNSLVEFDSPFRVTPTGELHAMLHDVWPPSAFATPRGGVSVEGAWTVISGYSGQYGYSGPIMHTSEYLGGRMAEEVLSTPGVYAVVSVLDIDYVDNDMDELDYAIGWVLLKLKEGGE